ncbi:hypothetical protein C8J25_108280 [Sphingomonas faeni]|uniref:Uncharacterized protein n=1 Tax=Sphingomonas faeni TaxID=185950 RepID=A0A2T5U0Z7_9SPHN|nr:hypothetical protein [Sphingomonas faeni]PTW45183.1 hypothetical protein C8J25_108280 [Sphingomonas faeni]
MSEDTISPGMLVAGAEYHRRLKKLGLHPEALMWARDLKQKQYCLIMVWSGVDKYGPLALSELLFSAYRKAVLPRSIDPFIVNVFSYQQNLAQVLVADWPKDAVNCLLVDGVTLNAGEYQDRRIAEEHADYRIQRDWVYTAQTKKRPSYEVGRDWERFQRNVTSMAA